MAISNHERLRLGLKQLASGLGPFVDARMAATVPDGKNWMDVLAARDPERPDANRRESLSDARFLLRVVTEEWRVFKDRLPRREQSFASELRQTGNDWAHGENFSADDTSRALDTMERLLTAIGATEQAREVRRLRLDLRRPTTEAVTEPADEHVRRAGQPVPARSEEVSRDPSGRPCLLVVEDQIMDELVRLLDDEFELLPATSYEDWREIRDSGLLGMVQGALIDRHLDVTRPGDSMGTTKIAEHLRRNTSIPAILMSVDVDYSTNKVLELCLKYRLLDVIRKDANGTLNATELIEAARSLVDPSPKGRRQRIERWVASVAYHVEAEHAFSPRLGKDRLLKCQEERDHILTLLQRGDLESAEQAMANFMSSWAPGAAATTP
jgi:hypothetical protein